MSVLHPELANRQPPMPPWADRVEVMTRMLDAQRVAPVGQQALMQAEVLPPTAQTVNVEAA